MKQNQRMNAQRHEQLSKHHLIQHSILSSLNAGPNGPAPSVEFCFYLCFGAQHSKLVECRTERTRTEHGVRFCSCPFLGSTAKLDGCKTAKSSAGHGSDTGGKTGCTRTILLLSTNSDLRTLLGNTPRRLGTERRKDCSLTDAAAKLLPIVARNNGNSYDHLPILTLSVYVYVM
jgi:hypothetical protein